MATEINYTVADAKNVQGFNQQILNTFITQGLILSADYSVTLSPSNTSEFISTLENIETPIPIFKIGLNVQL